MNVTSIRAEEYLSVTMRVTVTVELLEEDGLSGAKSEAYDTVFWGPGKSLESQLSDSAATLLAETAVGLESRVLAMTRYEVPELSETEAEEVRRFGLDHPEDGLVRDENGGIRGVNWAGHLAFDDLPDDAA